MPVYGPGRDQGSHSYLGTAGRIRYIARVGTTQISTGTIDYLGTVNRIGGGRVGSVGSVGRTGYAARIGSVGRIGSGPYLGSVNRIAGGRIGSIGSVGRTGYAARIGSVGRIGSGPYLGTVNRIAGGRIGSIGSVGRTGYAARIGSVGRIGSGPYIGSVNRIAGGRIGSVGSVGRIVAGSITRAGLNWAGSMLWTNRHVAVGSTYVGSWQLIQRFDKKGLVVRSSMAGSLFTIGGAVGTGVNSLTGTYARTDLGAGTYHSVSFTEPLQYVRAIVRVGSVGSGKGTLNVAFVRQG